ncbi:MULTISPECIES: HD domain-containing phosphohydrolase [unclassified Yoonia]|uniref:HD domain-containing phosphohydrolase n=1 Tax=unclassified Yoonia TaxID=2629118 RepID=UPI002AFFDFE1|nr:MULTISPECIES: HD domain-containing phosphohydrolase [unclassified Yoonia]
MRVCIVDDERISRSVIRAVLSRNDQYEVECFSDGVPALARCRETVFDLVLVDYRMSDMDGITCITHLRALADYQFVPVIMLTADHDRELRLSAVRAGATDFLNKPFDPEELRVRVQNLLSLRNAQLALMDRARHLDAEVQQATRKLVEREEELIWRLARAIELRDGTTQQHISRVAAVAEIIARTLGQSKTFCRTIYLAAPLHDTGKIGISDAVLQKPAALTPEERLEVQRHITIGAEILQDGESDLIRMAHEIALYHHEKWDGTGYGKGIAGADIPLSARITAVADVFDALCSQRPYKKAWSFDEAYAEILRQSGRHFDPQCVTAFTAGLNEIARYYPEDGAASHVA